MRVLRSSATVSDMPSHINAIEIKAVTSRYCNPHLRCAQTYCVACCTPGLGAVGGARNQRSNQKWQHVLVKLVPVCLRRTVI